jgi:hypothetical protein
MKKPSLVLCAALLAAAFTGSSVLAQQAATQEVDLSPMFTNLFNGSSVSIRYRNQTDIDKNKTHDQTQHRLDLRMGFKILPDGKLRVVTRATSGNSFADAWNETGLGKTAPNSEFNLPKVRQAYLDYSPTANLNLQGGFLAPTPDMASGALSIDEDGWVDGGRAAYSNLASWANKIVVTVGRVADYDKVNILDRSLKQDPNFLQVHVTGNLGARTKYMVEGTDFEEQQYVRAMVELAVRDITKFVDAVVVEEMMKRGDNTHQGFAASLKKAVGQTNIVTQYSYKTADLSLEAANRMPLQDEYRQGHQMTLKLDRATKIGTPFIHVGKTLGNDSTGNKIQVLSSQGARIEAGLKIGIGRKSR